MKTPAKNNDAVTAIITQIAASVETPDASPPKTAPQAVTPAPEDLSETLTQICFNAGQNDAQNMASTCEALAVVLEPLSNKTDATAVTHWKQARQAFIDGLVYEGTEPDTAAKRWTRLIATLGFTKPQTQAAKDMQSQRADEAHTEGKAPKAKTHAAHKDTAKNAIQAAAIKMDLSRIEAHLIGLIRQGKFTQAAQCVADLADKKVPAGKEGMEATM